MITTGSKYFLGLSIAAFVGLMLYGIGSNWGALGVVGIVSLMVAAGFLVSITSYTRDSTSSSLDTEALTTSAAAQAPAQRSLAPVGAAIGVALLALGLVTYQPVFVAGVVVLLYTVLAWMLTAWSEHASGSEEYNAEAKSRMLLPFEMPLLAALIAGVVAYSLSRVMLNVESEVGAVVFGGAAALVLIVGWVFSAKLPGKVLGALAAAGMVLVVGAGVATGLSGEREQLTEASHEDHFAAEHRECDSPEVQLFDEDAPRAVANTANVQATITLHDDDVLTARLTNTPSDTPVLTLSRGNVANIVFRNDTDVDRRLTLSLGTEVIEGTEGTRPVLYCTPLIGEGQAAMMTVRPGRPSSQFPDDPFQLFIPGVESAQIQVEVL